MLWVALIVALIWLGIALDVGGGNGRADRRPHRTAGPCSESADTAFADREHRKQEIEHDVESPVLVEATVLHSEQAGLISALPGQYIGYRCSWESRANNWGTRDM
ncbi:MAG: hypothetical protein QOJ56_6496 [Mycobacterium sp.]|jgi:hypothetical protein|nr:hypothetical protein [Mycobacterium sp.]